MSNVRGRTLCLSVALLLSALGRSARAQGSAVVLGLPASARAAAMGNAYAAASGDDASVFYNPAQLSTDTLHTIGLGFSVQRYVERSNAASLSASRKAGKGRLAIGLQLLDYGSEPEIIPDPDFGGERGKETGTRIGARDLVASLGYGVMIAPVRVGAGVKMVNQQVVDLSGYAMALDAGASVRSRFGTVALVVQNAGTRIELGHSTSELPLTYRAGMQSHVVRLGRAELVALVEATKLRKTPGAWSGGGELTFPTSDGLLLAVRGGVRGRVSADAGSRLTFGGGLGTARYGLDYAYQTVEGLETATHRVGFRWWR